MKGDGFMKADMREIGERIRSKRSELKMTQQDIYEKLDISQNHYSRIENGHTGMSFDILLMLSELLQLSTDYILTGKLENTTSNAFLDCYNRLTAHQKSYIEKHIQLFADANLK